MADKTKWLGGLMPPPDLNAEIAKATMAFPPRGLEDELRKALAPLTHDPAAELMKSVGSTNAFYLADQFRRMSEAPATLNKLWRTSFEALQLKDPLAELLKSVNANPLDVVSELRRITNAALAPQPRVDELLAASLVAYRNIYGKYGAAGANFFAGDLEVPEMVPGRRRRARSRRARAKERAITRRVGQLVLRDEVALTEAVERLDAASRKRDLSLLALELLLGTIISILMALYQNQLSNESEGRIVARVAAVEANLTERVARLEVNQDHRPLVYARRDLILRKGPRSQAASVAVWSPNVPGRIVTQRREWMRVEFYDRQRDEHAAGWCLKKWVLR